MSAVTSVVTGLAVVGSGVRLCFTPCHGQHVRFEDRGQPSERAEAVVCRRCQRCYTVTFPPVPLDQQQLAIWRSPDG